MLSKPRDAQIQAVENAIGVLLENVASLDEDRILRSFAGLIRATLRTSFFQQWEGACRDYISYKIDAHMLPDLPKPVPYREIRGCAPRGEGLHLRRSEERRVGKECVSA